LEPAALERIPSGIVRDDGGPVVLLMLQSAEPLSSNGANLCHTK
jgi:hypothetical protein